MSIPLYIDISTGEARVSLTGPIRQRLRFFLNDKVPLAIAFVQNGALITSTLLETGNATMKVGVRARPGLGAILAEATTYSLASEVAAVILPLDGSSLIAHFTDDVPDDQGDAELFLEVQVTNQAATTRATYYQSPCLIGREVNV